jgi:hypothetical protein
VLLRPLPFRDPQRLIIVWRIISSAEDPNAVCLTCQLQRLSRSGSIFANVTALVGLLPTLTGQGEPEDLQGAAVSHDTFAMLGVDPVLGRSFRPEEDEAGGERVVVLSHRLWQRRFGADPSIVGKSVTLSGENFTVIGVMPRGLTSRS